MNFLLSEKTILVLLILMELLVVGSFIVQYYYPNSIERFVLNAFMFTFIVLGLGYVMWFRHRQIKNGEVR